MSVLSALARLEAAQTGRAQRLTSVRHCHVSDHPLVLIPLRMAGETAAPLAVLLGTSTQEPTLLFTPQPRDRVLRFRFMDELAAALLPHIESFFAETVVRTTKSGEVTSFADAPQLWVPNPGGITFLKLLGRSTRFRRADGPYPVPERVPLLGRWLTWCCDRAELPGSSTIVPMTSTLAAHWASGQSALEDTNLAALLGWIDPPPGYTGPQAAARAEDPLVCPPAGPVTDPTFDNEELRPLMEAFDNASGAAAKTVAAERLHEALRKQLEPTWALMWQGLGLLRGLDPGAGVAARWDRDRNSFSYFAESLAESPPQARRDTAVSAVAKLLQRERALEELEVQRAFDDPWVMAEHRLAGDACAATVIEADPLRQVDGAKKKVLRPSIRVRIDDDMFTASVGDELFSIERPRQQATVLDVDGDLVELELSGGMGRKLAPEPGSVPEAGDRVGFARFSPNSFQPAAALPEREDTPWTHGGPPPEWVPSTADEQEEWA